ncbi:MAG: hypothetical protein HFI34_07245 [Lachnospiraceae bacterium]|nr:hypothetical protein [Lachnospiraceae bacterium]
MKQRFLEFLNSTKEYISNFDWNTYYRNNKMKIIMTVIGVVVLCFYATLFINAVSKANIVPQSETEQLTNEEEQTSEKNEVKDNENKNEMFHSPYSDESVPADLKEKINQMVLTPGSTGNTDLDDMVDEIVGKVCAENMSVYDKIKNIYDYLHYYSQVTDEQGIDDMGNTFADLLYESELDLEIVYRANRLLKNGYRGDSRDIASLFTILLKRIGVDAHYVSGHDYNYGYVAIMLDNEYYVFDLANEEKSADNTLNRYEKFAKNIINYPEQYTVYKIEAYMALSKNFARLKNFKFDIQISGLGHNYTKSMTYKDTTNETDNIISENLAWNIEKTQSVKVSGKVSDSTQMNTWKLNVYYYDLKNQFIGSVPIYNETTEDTQNEHIISASYIGTMRIEYQVMDENNHQCKYIVTISVKDNQVEPVTSGGQNPTTTNRVTGNQNSTTNPITNPGTEYPTTSNGIKPTINNETTPMTEPITKPQTDFITEPMTDPITESKTEPSTEPITEPITETSTEPVTEPTTEIPTESEAESVTEPAETNFETDSVSD